MQRKAIAIAVAAAVAAPMAVNAQPTIYGKLHFSLDYVDTNDKANVIDANGDATEFTLADFDNTDFATGVSRASRLGFKGSENLGGDLKAIWQVETQINTQGNNLSLRNTFAGLSGGWGTVVAGRHDTPYKIATASIDFWADTIADYNNIIGTYTAPTIAGLPTTAASTTALTTAVETGATPVTAFDVRAPQTIAYVTPNFSGFSAAAAWVSVVNPATGKGDTKDDQALSIEGMYDQGPFFASLAYEVQQGATVRGATGATDATATPAFLNNAIAGEVANSKVAAWKVGLAWRPKNAQIGVVYENIDDKVDDSPMSRDAWYVNGMYQFGGNWDVKAAYGMANKSDYAKELDTNDEGNFWAIGGDYIFSKRTSAYLIYAKADNKEAGAYGLTQGGQFYAPNLGQDVQSLSLGLIHKF
jgi:predicted porin